MFAPYQMRKPWADTGTSTARLMLASNEEDLGALYGSIKRPKTKGQPPSMCNNALAHRGIA
jgi:hypothetical protein